jgi:hypothetical protein
MVRGYVLGGLDWLGGRGFSSVSIRVDCSPSAVTRGKAPL